MPSSPTVHHLLSGSAVRAARFSVRRIRRWPVDSQQVARRNAMLACTALTAIRVEREEVEEQLRDLDTPAVARAHG